MVTHSWIHLSRHIPSDTSSALSLEPSFDNLHKERWSMDSSSLLHYKHTLDIFGTPHEVCLIYVVFFFPFGVCLIYADLHYKSVALSNCVFLLVRVGAIKNNHHIFINTSIRIILALVNHRLFVLCLKFQFRHTIWTGPKRI